MSYILDALNKSDQERQNTSGPTLQTIQRPPLGVTRKTIGWTTVLIPIGVLAVCLILWLMSEWKIELFIIPSATETQAAEKQLTPIPQQSTTDPAVPLVATTPVSTVTDQRENTSLPFETIQPSGQKALPEQEKVVVQFHLLPESIKRDIPPLTFSFHVYSENPAKRTIIINNRRLSEGAAVDSGLLLSEITPQGVIMQWKKHFFSINVVEQW